MAWHAALLRPDVFHAIAALSIHWSGIAPAPTPAVKPTDMMRAAVGEDGFLYILYFQEPGVAEAELDVDLRHTLRTVLYTLSGDIPRDQYRFFATDAKQLADNLAEPPGPLDWLSDADLDAFVESYSHHGTFFGGLNWYRCIDRSSGTPGAVRGTEDRAAGAVHRRRVRLDLRSDPRSGAGHPFRSAQPPRPHLDRRLRPLDPAGGTRAGQPRTD